MGHLAPYRLQVERTQPTEFLLWRWRRGIHPTWVLAVGCREAINLSGLSHLIDNERVSLESLDPFQL